MSCSLQTSIIFLLLSKLLIYFFQFLQNKTFLLSVKSINVIFAYTMIRIISLKIKLFLLKICYSKIKMSKTFQ